MTTFNLPDLGEGLTEATLLSWLVDEGEMIEVDQPIAEVETAKSSIEVPSPYAGIVVRLHGAVGETLIVGEPLITVDTDGSGGWLDDADQHDADSAGALSYREEERAGTAVPSEGTAAGAASEETPADSSDEGSGHVLIGYGTQASSGSRRRRRRRAGGDTTVALAERTPQQAPRVSSPLVRRLAREHEIPLGGVTGTGPEGLIVRADVLAALRTSAPKVAETRPPGGDAPATSAAVPAPSAPQATEQTAPAPSSRPAPGGLEVSERVHVTGLRKAVSTTLSRSRREIPEATVWQDADFTELLALRARLKRQAQTSGAAAPSLLALIGRFVLAGLARHPELATRVDTREDGEQEIVHFDGVNLGFAAQTDAGLVVPVIRHAERLSARALHEEIGRLVGAAREGTISGRELTGGTFTVNNYGVFGSDGATPIINHPEVAILGLGRILERPWVVDGELTVRSISTLTLAFDHRVCDGGAAGGFLDFVARCVEDPSTALADL
ncbi:dihydrolipoamide acetyltransferase family protein [Nesterenkonia xinjiangensis]|uniref:Dihydrolipoamide acetyltransferase component of pyruvate dehydrogenase complex n=1 Tax=Nesterenkonia xinjiangensis TaxID=225327 RepID=A0A7Z0GMQ3_9MICC|nr:dihydrolipoamide acetyltransferase family protein [Nesterenkonia xinjiangensis]NYJ78827.1 pyruvate dehydrogenase E2 component (dihydrolipoamide acetyltransferase) [Nesterenkonia xinjiangensis]